MNYIEIVLMYCKMVQIMEIVLIDFNKCYTIISLAIALEYRSCLTSHGVSSDGHISHWHKSELRFTFHSQILYRSGWAQIPLGLLEWLDCSQTVFFLAIPVHIGHAEDLRFSALLLFLLANGQHFQLQVSAQPADDRRTVLVSY